MREKSKKPRPQGRGFFFTLMTFYAFHLLSPIMQLYWVLKHGILLA
jgi:hypothetical protein